MTYREQAHQVIEDFQEAVDETRKSDSIRRIEKILDRIDTEILDREIIAGLDDLQNAVEDYRGIERAGLTPEEYQDEKEAAFEVIQEAVDGLDIDEDALESLEEEEIEKPPPAEPPVKTRQEQIMEFDYNHTLNELKRMAREKGISPSGTKHEIIGKLI